MSELQKYTVGWICALPVESIAAQALLDEEYDEIPTVAHHDHNNYALGRIANHHIVIAVLPDGEYGSCSAAAVARDMLHTFPNVRIGLMVGIGGGAPSPKCDVRLGDVVVSSRFEGRGGVFQYDYGKAVQNQDISFQHTDFLDQPPTVLRTAVTALKSKHRRKGHQLNASVEEALQRWPRLKDEYSRPLPESDRLYKSDVVHPDLPDECQLVCSSAPKNLVERINRGKYQDDPAVHYGLIASANQLVKDSRIRDKLAEKGVLCFEMEAAGLMNHFPCLVIRGICDYADSHKNKAWQGFAAMMAAAYARDLLLIIPPERVLQEKAIPQLVSDPILQELVLNQNEAILSQKLTQDIRYENDKHVKCHQAFKTSKYEAFKDINPDRVPGTCKWVLEHPQYIRWRQSPCNDLLWISADPGCGKSVLATSLVNSELRSTTDHTICYFFFKDNEEQNSVTIALCAILHQVFDSQPTLLRHAVHAFENNGTKLQNEVDELWRILLAAASDKSAKAVTCVLDALDECQEGDRRKLIRLLTDFHFHSSSTSARKFNLKFLVTSRPYQDIELGFSHVPPDLPSIRLAGEESNADISEEINLVIRQKIQAAGDYLHPEQEVRDAIQAKLLETPHRTYLWLHLVWNELELTDKRTQNGFLKKIGSLPSTVEDAYERILNRHDSRQRAVVRTLLHIVVSARRPLTLREMDVAFQLATESPDALKHEDLDLDGQNLKTRLRRLCGLFVFVSDSRIYLIHQTAKEFLIASRNTKDSAVACWRHSLHEQCSNKVMAKICVQYLSFCDMPDTNLYSIFNRSRFSFSSRSDEQEVDATLANFPLLEYSSLHWPAHFRDMGITDGEFVNRALKLYDVENERFKTWTSILLWNHNEGLRGSDLQPIHMAALNGHTEALSKIIQVDRVSVNETGSFDVTAVLLAALEGHGETVKLLLDKGAYHIQSDTYGAALWAASKGGHLVAVKLLLEKGADFEMQGNYSSALQIAAAGGHLEVVKLLLENGAAINIQGPYGSSPLQVASEGGHLEVVKLLIEKGADIDMQSRNGDGPLQVALAKGHLEVVKLLLEKGAAVNIESQDGTSPLQVALARGHVEVVKLLLEKGADVYTVRFYGPTALQEALGVSHGEFTDILKRGAAAAKMASDFTFEKHSGEASSGISLTEAHLSTHIAQRVIEMPKVEQVGEGTPRSCT